MSCIPCMLSNLRHASKLGNFGNLNKNFKSSRKISLLQRQTIHINTVQHSAFGGLQSSVASKESPSKSCDELPASCWKEQVLFMDEIMDTLSPEEHPGIYLDMTLGAGSHSRAILQRCPRSKVIAVDRDPATAAAAAELQRDFPGRLCYLNIKFSAVASTLHRLGLVRGGVQGAVLDAGPSKEQQEDPARGFRDTAKHKLDMRMDGPDSPSLPAYTIIQNIDEQDLHRVFKNLGGIDSSRKLARALVQARYEMHRVTTPRDLVQLVCGIYGVTASVDGYRGYVPSSVVNTFQALRMLVNDEARELDCAVRTAHWALRPSRALAVLTHNSLEDSLVKTHLKGLNVDAITAVEGTPMAKFHKTSGNIKANDCLPWTPLTKHVQKLHWQTRLNASYWKNTKLRTAVANPGVVYC